MNAECTESTALRRRVANRRWTKYPLSDSRHEGAKVVLLIPWSESSVRPSAERPDEGIAVRLVISLPWLPPQNDWPQSVETLAKPIQERGGLLRPSTLQL